MQAGRASAIDRLQLEDGTREHTESRQRQAELAGPGRTRAPTTPRPAPDAYPVSRIPYPVSVGPYRTSSSPSPRKKSGGGGGGRTTRVCACGVCACGACVCLHSCMPTRCNAPLRACPSSLQRAYSVCVHGAPCCVTALSLLRPCSALAAGRPLLCLPAPLYLTRCRSVCPPNGTWRPTIRARGGPVTSRRTAPLSSTWRRRHQPHPSVPLPLLTEHLLTLSSAQHGQCTGRG